MLLMKNKTDQGGKGCRHPHSSRLDREKLCLHLEAFLPRPTPPAAAAGVPRLRATPQGAAPPRRKRAPRSPAGRTGHRARRPASPRCARTCNGRAPRPPGSQAVSRDGRAGAGSAPWAHHRDRGRRAGPRAFPPPPARSLALDAAPRGRCARPWTRGPAEAPAASPGSGRQTQGSAPPPAGDARR